MNGPAALLLDVEVADELLVVVEDCVECGAVRKIPAAAAPTMTITITINTRRVDSFVLPRGLAVEVKLFVARGRLGPFK